MRCQIRRTRPILALRASGADHEMAARRLGLAVGIAALLSCGVAEAQNTAAQPPPLTLYGQLPGVEAMALSPDGKRIATVSRIKGDRRLVVAEYNGALLSAAPMGDTKLRGLQFAGNDTVLLTKSSTIALGMDFTKNQYEAFGTLIVPLNGKDPELVFSRDRLIATITLDSYGLRQRPDGLTGYFSGIALAAANTGVRFDHGRPTLYEVNLARNSAKRLASPAGEGHDRSWLIDESGQVAATLDIATRDGQWQITGTGGRVLATGVAPTGAVSLTSLGKDGKSVIYRTIGDDDSKSYFEVPLAGGTSAYAIPPGDNLYGLYVDQDNGRMLGYMLLRNEAQVPVFFDAGKQAAVEKVLRAFGKRRVWLVDWTPDFGKLLVHTSGSQDSGTYYLVDVKAGKAEEIGLEYPGIEPEAVGPVSVVDYRAGDGLAMNGILTLPPGREARNLPVILLPHGGPHAADEPVFDWWAQAFASRGYAVFQPNFRGSTNRDGPFKAASRNEWGRKMQTDISDGLAELARRGIVDPKRACIVGASYGGYAALAGVTLQQGVYRCAVAVAPVADLELMRNAELYESNYDPMLARALRADIGDPKGYDAVSPRQHAQQADAPILLIHGKDDTVVPFQHSASMASALQAAHKPYELVVLKHEDHWLSKSDTRLQMLTEAMRFVQQHNPVN